MIVAIDGTVCSGKSTVARLLSHNLKFGYVNSGAIYRAFTYMVLKENLQDSTTEEIVKRAKKLDITMKTDENAKFIITAGGEDITPIINLPHISKNVAWVAQIPELRKIAREVQYKLAKNGDTVVEGRDIGTEVFPNAEVKFFMTADIDVRAKRRYNDYLKAGKNIPLEEVKKDVIARDKADMEREISPLVPSEDAIIYYNNGSDVNAVIEELSKIVLEKKF